MDDEFIECLRQFEMQYDLSNLSKYMGIYKNLLWNKIQAYMKSNGKLFINLFYNLSQFLSKKMLIIYNIYYVNE